MYNHIIFHVLVLCTIYVLCQGEVPGLTEQDISGQRSKGSGLRENASRKVPNATGEPNRSGGQSIERAKSTEGPSNREKPSSEVPRSSQKDTRSRESASNELQDQHAEVICPDKWVPSGDRCYFVSKETKTFSDASVWCQENAGPHHSASLLAIQTAVENALIYAMLAVIETACGIKFPDDVWIGLQYDPNSSSYKWIDGTSSEYTNWKGEAQSKPCEDTMCVYMSIRTHQGKWSGNACSQSKFFVCEAGQRIEAEPPIIEPINGNNLAMQ